MKFILRFKECCFGEVFTIYFNNFSLWL